jgi:repressor LexA
MNDTPKLTPRQQQILDLIQSAIANTGSPPTRAEIAHELGFKSANAAEEHLQALARKGVIELVSGTSRGIRLKGQNLRTMQHSFAQQFTLPLQSLAQLSLPLIMDGDLLAVQSTREARNGQIVIARLGDEVTVKRFRRTATQIELLAENPDFQTIVVEPGEPFEIEGLAVGLIRNTMLM